MKNKPKPHIRKLWIFFSAGIIAALVVAAIVIFIPGNQPVPAAIKPIEYNEHMKTIEEMGKPRHERPVIAIIAQNDATEVTDLMIPYGILQRSGVADVIIVAENTTPIPLYPFSKISQGPELFKIKPQATMQEFDKQYPDGADYVVVPALLPRDDKAVVDWINAQHHKGSHVVSVCAGALTLAATGLLDNRPATTHWAYVDELQKAHPTVKIIKDQRYVADNGITTATGISASIPTMVALVEAIAGQQKAAQVAKDIGLDHWDARHRSSDFQLNGEYRKTYLRNWLSFWRKETLGVPVQKDVDEMALALTVDAYSRTELSKVITIGETVRSKHGLTIYPNTAQPTGINHMLPAPSSDKPAQTIDRELEQIALRYDRPTAEIVALTIEYPWASKVSTKP